MVFWRMLTRLLVIVAIGMPMRAAGAHEPDDRAAEEDLDLEALVREAETLIDVVLQHHLAPPARQEMWRAGAMRIVEPRIPDATGRARFRPAVLGFRDRSERILEMKTAAELIEYLQELWAAGTIPRDRASAAELKQAFLFGVLEPVLGFTHLIPRSDVKAREQIGGNRYIGTGIANGYDDERGYPTIGMIIPGGPMARAGGRDGDRS
jgi:hypothetical protein